MRLDTTHIRLLPVTGTFAENKDVARDVRIKKINPALKKGNEVVLDFAGIDAVTQSFVHALISELIREYGSEVLDVVFFKNCNEKVRSIIDIVVEYMQV
ncbi:STAS-like domain-containing protein [Candidatus Roizmanbacteria bacterium]|nr:STAS-like domain-containing protein [Candidatus Roizmanbacteria bacterium]